MKYKDKVAKMTLKLLQIYDTYIKLYNPNIKRLLRRKHANVCSVYIFGRLVVICLLC